MKTKTMIHDHIVSVKGVPYTLRLGTNALCRLEDVLGPGIGADLFLVNLISATTAGTLRLADVRRVVWAALIDHHPEVTEEEAGRLVDDAGGPEEIAKPLAGAIQDACLALFGRDKVS